MGLRMYRDPDEVDSKQSTIKSDPTAAARSAIRRQRSVRYSPNTRLPSMPTISSSTYRPLSTSGRTRTSSDRQWQLEDIRRRESALDSLSRNAGANDMTNPESSRQGNSFVRSTDPAPNRSTQRQRRGSGSAPVEHIFISEHTSDRISLARNTTVPPAPEPHYLRGTTPMPRDFPLGSANMDTSLATYWPRPPHTSGDSSDSTSISRPMPALGTASLTPRFAPAHRFSGEVEGDSVVAGQTFTTRQESLAILAERLPSPEEVASPEDRVFLSMFASHLETMRRRSPETLTTPYLTAEAAYLRNIEQRLNHITVGSMTETRSASADSLLPLRRMTPDYNNEARRVAVLQTYRLTRDARMRHSNLDGLGDRQRSFSPDDENWETMLATITPDERVPSAHSSFTTATASATSQSSNSVASSYGTLVTVPSNRPENETCPAEDSDSGVDNASDANNEDMSVEEARDLHQQARSRLDGYQTSLADLVQHSPWRAHQAQMGDFSRDLARREAHRAELHRQLQRLENELERLNRDIAEDRDFDRQRPEERL